MALRRLYHTEAAAGLNFLKRYYEKTNSYFIIRTGYVTAGISIVLNVFMV